MPSNPFLDPAPQPAVSLPVPNPFHSNNLPPPPTHRIKPDPIPRTNPKPTPISPLVPKLSPEHEMEQEMDDWNKYTPSKCPGNCPAFSGHDSSTAHSSPAHSSPGSSTSHTESQYLELREELAEIKNRLSQILGLVQFPPTAQSAKPPSKTKRRDSL